MTRPPVAQDQIPVRCAVYIRVNVGAVQNTKAIRRQRETAEVFLKSRESDGWICVGTYEDNRGSVDFHFPIDDGDIDRCLLPFFAGYGTCDNTGV